MRKLIVMLVAICSIYCLVGCGSGDTQQEASDENQRQSSVQGEEAAGKEINSEVVEATAEESTSEVTGENPATESLSESTEEAASVVYEGIDMESDLPGEEWMATFVDIITEPKVVVFSDETGHKEIIEEGAKVTINPDTDVIAIYLPEGYEYASKSKGINKTQNINGGFYMIFHLDPEKTREKKRRNAAIYVDHGSEEIALEFEIWSE